MPGDHYAQEQAYTRFANNGITTASFSLRHNLSIVTTRDARTGSYATNDLDDDSLRAAVKKAEELAALTPQNSERLSPVGPQEFPKTFDFDEHTANARSPEMIPHVKTIIDAAMKQKLVAAGLVERSHRVTAIANNTGVFGFHNSSDSQLTTTIRMADGSSSGWAGPAFGEAYPRSIAPGSPRPRLKNAGAGRILKSLRRAITRWCWSRRRAGTWSV